MERFRIAERTPERGSKKKLSPWGLNNWRMDVAPKLMEVFQMFLQTVFEEGGFVEVRVTKDVLSENLPLFKGELYGFTDRPGLTLALDFEGVAHLCSRALGVLAVASWRLQKSGGVLRVANLNSNLRRIFRYARLDQSMDLVESRPTESNGLRTAAAA